MNRFNCAVGGQTEMDAATVNIFLRFTQTVLESNALLKPLQSYVSVQLHLQSSAGETHQQMLCVLRAFC